MIQITCPKCSDTPCAHHAQLTRFVQVLLNSMDTINRFMIPLPDGVSPYLERLVLDRKPDGSATYLHLLWAADDDRDPHDHPFDFASRIVFGGYDEAMYREDGSIHQLNTFTVGQVNAKMASTLHRITQLHAVPTVTLVHRGPKIREWGFQTLDGWEHHKDYIARKFPGAQPTEVDW